MTKRNKVYIATSIDGFIADKNGGIDWLNETPNPDQDDLGYADFMANIDAVLMGRNTFDIVRGFDMDWPYTVPVYVLSNSLREIPADIQDRVFLVNGSLTEVLAGIHKNGHGQLYIDGGGTVQGFLREDLIDDLTITHIPVLLGEGIPLFKTMPNRMDFELVSSVTKIGQLVQTHYERKG